MCDEIHFYKNDLYIMVGLKNKLQIKKLTPSSNNHHNININMK